jgi:hypothetical protein
MTKLEKWRMDYLVVKDEVGENWDDYGRET